MTPTESASTVGGAHVAEIVLLVAGIVFTIVVVSVFAAMLWTSTREERRMDELRDGHQGRDGNDGTEH